MTPEQAFLAAIVIEPHEDVHRLVFADYLMEHPEAIVGVLRTLTSRAIGGPPDDPRFAATEFVVAANSNEMQQCWEDYASDSPRRRHDFSLRWVQDNPGKCFSIGTSGGKDINVSFFWNLLNGHRVMSYETTGWFNDLYVVDEWLKAYCNPVCDGGARRAHTNAMNFHTCVQFCRGTP